MCTPARIRRSRLASYAGWRESVAFTHGTSATGTVGSPRASLTSPRARVSLIPAAHLFTVLKLAGATSAASPRGANSGSSGPRKSLRTGYPVVAASAAASIHASAAGVATTHTRQPAAPSSPTVSAASRAGGAAHTIR